MRWLKAVFEVVPVTIAFDSLEAQGFDPEGGSDEGVLVFYTDRNADDLRDAIWELNGGNWCEVTTITEEEADVFL